MSADARVAEWLRRRILERIEILEGVKEDCLAMAADPTEPLRTRFEVGLTITQTEEEIAALRRRPELAG